MSPLLQSAVRPQPDHYVVDGEKYVRVTTVIGLLNNPGLIAWKVRVGADEAERIGRAARDHGTRLHKALEELNTVLVNGGTVLPSPPNDLAPWVDRYADWLSEHVERVLASERFCPSRWYRFGGTCDAVVLMRDGRKAVLDFKTDKWRAKKDAHALQLAAYRLALAEDGLTCGRRIVLQFPSDSPGELVPWEYEAHRVDTDAFLHLLEVFRWLNGHPA